MPPIYVMMKPVSGLCNMRCRYCFYADEMQNREEENRGMMSEATLENVIRKAMEAAEGEVTFAYQGGEPTLRGLEFFEKVVELQRKYGRKRLAVHNALQTNGYLIDERWCEFFCKNEFLIGLSVDGTMKTHNLNRLDVNREGTYERCMRAAELMKHYGVEFNILTVVNRQTAPKIRKIYQDYERRGFHYQQYIACLDPLASEPGKEKYSLLPQMYGEFLTELFQLWYDDWKEGRQPYIRLFENYIGIFLGYPPESCEQSGVCGYQHVVEADGRVYPCDFYMLDEYELGNLNEIGFQEIRENRKKIRFVENSMNHGEECRACTYFHVCRGGCNRNRILNETTGSRRNYFCESYRMLFDAHYGKLMQIAEEIRRGQRR